MTKRDDGAGRQRKFITFNQLCERWGDCAHMTLEIRLRKDPNFPKVYQLPGSRLRLFDVEQVETYERASVVARPKHELA